MHEQGVERRRTLYSMLAGLPDGNVDLSVWRNVARDETLIAAAKRRECGTIACAVGWACAYPEFQAQGLTYELGWPTFRKPGSDLVLGDWEAVEEFFGLDSSTSCIFLPRYRPMFDGAKEDFDLVKDSDRLIVMRRIRRLLMDEGVITAERNRQLARQEGAPE